MNLAFREMYYYLQTLRCKKVERKKDTLKKRGKGEGRLAIKVVCFRVVLKQHRIYLKQGKDVTFHNGIRRRALEFAGRFVTHLHPFLGETLEFLHFSLH